MKLLPQEAQVTQGLQELTETCHRWGPKGRKPGQPFLPLPPRVLGLAPPTGRS